MAGSSNSTGSKKTSRSSTGTRPRSKTSTKASSNSNSRGKKASTKQVNAKIRMEVVVLLIFCVVLVLFLCMLGIIKGTFGPGVKSVLLGIFGVLAYIIPIISFVAICFKLANKGNGIATLKLVAGIVLTFLIGILLCYITGMKVDEIASGGHIWKDLYEFQGGGGVLFGLFACLLDGVFGKVGTIILDVIFMIICLVILTEKSFIHMLKDGSLNIYGAVKKGRDYLEDNFENYEVDDEPDEEYELEKQRRIKEKRDKRAKELADRQERLQKEKEEKREAAKARKEEENRRREEEEKSRRQEQDRMDDERILGKNRPKKNSENVGKTINFDLTSAENLKNNARKDEMHEIMLTSNDDAEKHNSREYVTPDLKGANVVSSNHMTEITFHEDAVSDVFASANQPDELILGKESSPIVSEVSKIEVTKHEPVTSYMVEDSEVVANHNSLFFEENNELDKKTIAKESDKETTKESTLAKDMSYSSNVESSSEIPKAHNSIDDDYVPQKPLPSFSSGNKPSAEGSLGNENKAVSSNNYVDITGMPDPVTERTHQQMAENTVVIPEEKPKVFKKKKYEVPSVELLRVNDNKNKGDSDQHLKETALRLQQTLKTFGVAVTVTDISQGPSVTRYELQLGEGIKVNKIVNLADDIKLNLAAQDIRIEAPIPGKAAVGIEIPNKETSEVLIRELLDSNEFRASASKMTFAVGKDISGKTIVADIAKMPHMLIAGATGSGKSVCINTLIMSILYKASPEEVKMIMIDPKVVELSVYNGIPHLMIPVVTDPKKASAALQWAVNEMTKRYKLFADLGVRDLKGYNAKIAPQVNENDPEAPKILPQIVVIVDELADLMMVASKEVEEAICRLAQLARAAGIHLIIATQRPSVDVITGLIKANMPSRVAFKVTSGVDSRTILDMIGAEKLLGKGDMLFFPQGYSKPLRVQGAFVSDSEVEDVVEFLKSNAGDDVYDEEVEKQISGIHDGPSSGNAGGGDSAGAGNGYDDYFVEACRFVVEKEKASSGMLQRVFKIGFNRAGRIVDQMEEAGVVGPEEGTKPRKVLMTKNELEIFLEDNGFV